MNSTPTDPDDPGWSPAGVIGRLRDLADKVVGASQDLAVAGARKVPGPLAQPLAEYLDLVTQLSDLLTGPLQTLLDEQQRLADQLATWSQRNADLSDQLAEWAEQHRRVTERMQTLVRPTVGQVRRATEAARGLTEELRRAE